MAVPPNTISQIHAGDDTDQFKIQMPPFPPCCSINKLRQVSSAANQHNPARQHNKHCAHHFNHLLPPFTSTARPSALPSHPYSLSAKSTLNRSRRQLLHQFILTPSKSGCHRLPISTLWDWWLPLCITMLEARPIPATDWLISFLFFPFDFLITMFLNGNLMPVTPNRLFEQC